MDEIPKVKLDENFEQLENILQDLKVMTRDVDDFEGIAAVEGEN